MPKSGGLPEEKGKSENPITPGDIEKMNLMLVRLENSGLKQYVRLSQNLPKVLWLNFLSGVARGLGFTVGTAILLTLAYKIVGSIISMNIPYLTEMLEDFVALVRDMAIRGR